MLANKIFIYDTTLRDGEQGANISFSLIDKISITRKLDELGVSFIEGGWPNPTNPKANEYFQEANKLELKNAKLCAFGSTRLAKNNVKEDTNLEYLIKAQTQVVTIFGKTWDMHVTKVLGTTLDENIKMIKESIEYLKDNNREVVFDAEHFFDGYKNNPEYAYKCLEAAEKAGADWIVLCDTNGGTIISEFNKITSIIKESFKTPLGIHTHNDMGTAEANSLIAVDNGFTQIQGTMNGFGERCGNANLTTLIPVLSLKMGYHTVNPDSIKHLKSYANYFYDMANMIPKDNQPFVGHFAFAHKAGVHANAIIKEDSSYEHIKPEKVGNKRQILISEHAGLSSLIFKAKEFGFDLNPTNPETKELLHKLKTLEHNGYEFDGADASLKIFLIKNLYKHKPFFTLEGSRIIVEKNSKTNQSEATIKIRVKNLIEHTAAEGNGPVNALDNALRKALLKFYPEIEGIKLVDYKVRVIEGSSGTSAQVKVFIETKDSEEVWATVGVSSNIIEASWISLVDSIEYKLLKERFNYNYENISII